jgi:putative membrane protein
MHMTLLGALLALAPRPLYIHLHEQAGGLAGLTPLDDQHLGGAIMLLVGGVSYLSGGLLMTARLLRDPVTAPAERS